MKNILKSILGKQTLTRALTLIVLLTLLLPIGSVSAAPLKPAPQQPAPRAIPAAPNQVSPSGVTSTNNPTYSWTEVAGATHYLFFVNDNGVATNVWWYNRSEALCNGYTCSIKLASNLTSGKEYSWYVLARDATGYGGWAGPMYYGYSITAPSTPVLVSPGITSSTATGATAGCTTTANPTFTWVAQSSSTRYLFFIATNATTPTVVTGSIRWYTPAEANCSTGSGNCSIQSPVSLASGDYYWWILAHNIAGETWSNGMPFTYMSTTASVPDVPVPTEPLGTKTAAVWPYGPYYDADYKWNAVTGATDYLFYVEDRTTSPSTATRVKWYTGTDASCASASTCSIKASSKLDYGVYRWYVLSKNKCGYSNWSSAMDVTYCPTSLTAATIRTPTGGQVVTTQNPTYTWDRVTGATNYYIYLATSTGTPVTNKTYTRAEANCATGSTCSVTPAESAWSLTDGQSYKWNVTAMDSCNAPVASTDSYFTYSSSGTLGSPTMLKGLPRLAINTCATPGLPSFQWTASPGATDYRIEVPGSINGVWKTAAAVGCTGAVTTCTWTPVAADYINAIGWNTCNTNYTLSVQAKSSSSTSTVASQTIKFAQSTGASLRDGFYEAAPAAPTLVAPADGATGAENDVNPTTTVFSWTSADYTEAPDYQMVVFLATVTWDTCTLGVNCWSIPLTDTDMGCSADNSCDSTTGVTPIDLTLTANSTQYKWQVRGLNAWGNGSWSTARTFTTDP